MLHSRTLGQGPDLVLIHGWGMNAAVWEDVATILAAKFRVTLIDLPGHGHSPWVEGEFTNLAEWINSCLEVAPPTAIWIGWSLGGTLALQAALTAPQRIRALVMVTATPSFLRSDHWPYGLAANTLERFLEDLNTNWAGTLGRFLTLQVRGSNDAVPVLRTLRRRLATEPSPNLHALHIGLNLLKNTDLSAQLPTLKVPNMWLYGRRDTLIPQRGAETLAQLLPAAQINVIHGAAHAPFISHRDQALTLLRQFIAAINNCQS